MVYNCLNGIREINNNGYGLVNIPSIKPLNNKILSYSSGNVGPLKSYNSIAYPRTSYKSYNENQEDNQYEYQMQDI